MKLPAEFTTELELLGKKIIAEDLTRDEGAQELVDKTFRKAHRHLLESIIFAFWRGKLNKWIKDYISLLTADEQEQATGIKPLFDWLPNLIETAPGRFVHQNAMTASDLRKAVIQATTKADNARGFAVRIQRLADAALPLMNDEATTVADVAEQIENRLAAVDAAARP